VPDVGIAHPAREGAARLAAREVKVHAQALASERRARRTASAGGTLIVGPWTSEVGFELLYWIPFLRRLLRRYGVDRERVVAVSRGGTAEWYADIASRYVDLLDRISPDELLADQARREERSGGQKQTRVTAFDRRCIELAREQVPTDGRVRVLHPSLMYRRYRPAWMGRVDPQAMSRSLTYAPIDATPRPPEGLEVGEYVAVKAYFSRCFPPAPEGVEAVRGVVTSLASRMPVVLLHSNVVVDDHEDLDLGDIPGVRFMRNGHAGSNLANQSGVVAGARALLATYGGFSYLGPFLGVPTMAFYSTNSFNPVHLDLMRSAADALRASSAGPGRQVDYMLFATHDLPLIDLLRGVR
jgi:hypothetical protein